MKFELSRCKGVIPLCPVFGGFLFCFIAEWYAAYENIWIYFFIVFLFEKNHKNAYEKRKQGDTQENRTDPFCVVRFMRLNVDNWLVLSLYHDMIIVLDNHGLVRV